jgi:hypothetical protein
MSKTSFRSVVSVVSTLLIIVFHTFQYPSKCRFQEEKKEEMKSRMPSLLPAVYEGEINKLRSSAISAMRLDTESVKPFTQYPFSSDRIHPW